MLLAVHYRVMEHLGSLESTQEARVALGELLRFFRALQTSLVLYLTIRLWARDFYEVIVDEAEGRINYRLIEIESE